MDTFLSRSGSSHFQTQVQHPKAMIELMSGASTPSQSYERFCSVWLHLEGFLSRFRSSHFRTHVHLPKAITHLLPYGFIWTPFNADLEQAKAGTYQVAYQMVGHLISKRLRESSEKLRKAPRGSRQGGYLSGGLPNGTPLDK